nr:uncharacterized protein LOC117980562 [Pan paniscus]
MGKARCGVHRGPSFPFPVRPSQSASATARPFCTHGSAKAFPGKILKIPSYLFSACVCPRLHLPSPTHLPGRGRQPGWGLGKGGVAQGPGSRAGAARRPAFLGAGPAPAFPTRPHPVAAETRPRPPQRTKHPHFAPPRPSALGPPLSRQAPLESAARPPAGSRAQPGCLVSPGRATSLPPVTALLEPGIPPTPRHAPPPEHTRRSRQSLRDSPPTRNPLPRSRPKGDFKKMEASHGSHS